MMEPDPRLHFHLAVGVCWPCRGAWCGDRDGGAVVPDIIMGAWVTVCGAPGRHRAWGRGRADWCVSQNIRTPPLIPILCGSYRVRNIWAKRGAFVIIYGYARVSTIGQALSAQAAALHEAGAAKVFKEKISGAANHRAQLHRLLNTIDAGDLVIVTRLDRLARSTRDLLNILDTIAKAGATFKSLGDAWADTTTAHGRLMLTVLGGLAEFERELIRVRTGEGRVRAKARGVHLGRPFKLNRHQQREAIARREAGEALTDIARTFGVHHTTIGRLRAQGNATFNSSR
jgi:DNA invertase Pin-like site-specific DNA recombinase